MNVPDPSPEHLNILRKYFGHSQFRPMQWKIIYSLLEKKQDNCVIMATGYGKSLCYQYPPVYANGLAIVISPLISLMQDQVLSLTMANISSCYFGSAQTSHSKSLNSVLSGECRVLYVTPEWCTGENGQHILKTIKESVPITLLAIDEAHCVSQWGHDFRTSYRKLGNFRHIIGDIPVLAVTATATPQVRLDICRSLNMRNAQVTCTSFDRPNLYFAVSTKTNDVFDDIKKLLSKGPDSIYKFLGPTIIYCPTKKQTEKVADDLNVKGIRCGMYHADMNFKDRQIVHEQFVKDALQVVVATVAFGMGIDKPDVRCVIHYGAPKEIESYYQEVGRAGRDGLPSICHVFYSVSDFTLQKYFAHSNVGEERYRLHREKMVRLMQQFLETRDCRRHLLLTYFEDINVDKPRTLHSNCCDNCNKSIKTGKTADNRPEININEEVKLFLKVIDLFKGRFGLTVPIKFLRGSKDAKIPKYLLNHDLHGRGQTISEPAWKAIGRLCLNEGLTREKSCNFDRRSSKSYFPASTTEITILGHEFMKMGEQCGVKLALTTEIETLFLKKVKLPIETEKSDVWKNKLNEYKCSKKVNQKERERQVALFNVLKKLREQLAEKHKCAPHMVFTDVILHSIAVKEPLSESALFEIVGFTEAKMERFGKDILNKIKEFCGQKTDSQETTSAKFEDNDEIFDMISDELFANITDYSNTNTNFKAYEITDQDLAKAEVEKVKSTIDSEVDQDIWGGISDELFDSVPLDDLEVEPNTRFECASAKTEPYIQIEDSVSMKATPSIEFDYNSTLKTESYIEKDHEIVKTKPSTVFESNSTAKTELNVEIESNQLPITIPDSRKRVLPLWLTKSNAKEVIKKKVKSSSLFKM